MSTSMLSSLESVLAKMQALSDVAGNRPISAKPTSSTESGFAAELSRSLQRLSAMQNQAQDQAKAFEAGVPGIALNDVMIDMQTASVAFQTTVQVRNRLVAAYQEIASMPV
ncbi:flagellar hook-basal body complex protein FliE [Paenalcaligenes suwonensis]|uniref:flagellar hook-basal body complex protein FliE n=1 Tax=Paenalcaligenes suwonensis TaxID=1202713 RepID=UPI00140AC473|nr:flagellar hook-basal body complex protein FliE [Paenalcaligenes suwonensis]NHC61823.1 flagellar hook-basal body complex protein FliE [Paenalcaligenes suwonensis]